VIREQRSFCRICVAMCGIVVTVDESENGTSTVTKVRGDPDHPLSSGYTCTKGRALPQYHHHPRRIDDVLRRDRPGTAAVACGWGEALDEVATIVREAVRDGGPDSVAAYFGSGIGFDSCGRPVAERFLASLGSQQKYTSMTVDTPCKPLVAELVGGWSGLMPTLDPATDGLVLFVGTNPVVSHGHSNGLSDPVQRIRRITASGGTVWVIDPRRTETATLAVSLGGQHLQPRPSTDWLILAWLVRELLAAGADAAYLAAHTSAADLDRVAAELAPFTLEVVARRTGIGPDQLRALLELVRSSPGVSVVTGTGTSMQQTANIVEWLAWLVQIVTGSLDRDGGMWFNPGFLRQAHRFPPRAGRSSATPGPASRPELARRFGEIPCSALVSEIEAGHITVVFVVGGSPLTAFPEPDRLAAAFARLRALVVIDVVENETSAVATHVLPATDQLERADVPLVADGLQLAVASQYTAAIVAPTQQHRPVWWMFAELARRLGQSLLPGGKDPEEVTEDELIADLLGRAAMDLPSLRAHPTGVVVEEPVFGWVRERVLPGGVWRVAPDGLVDQLRQAATAEPTDLLLIPRRLPGTMNSQLRGVTAAGAWGIRLNPADAGGRGIGEGSTVMVSSAAGAVTTVAALDPRVQPGTASMTHGWDDPNAGRLASSTAGVDALTGMVHLSGLPIRISLLDPTTAQP